MPWTDPEIRNWGHVSRYLCMRSNGHTATPTAPTLPACRNTTRRRYVKSQASDLGTRPWGPICPTNSPTQPHGFGKPAGHSPTATPTAPTAGGHTAPPLRSRGVGGGAAPVSAPPCDT